MTVHNASEGEMKECIEHQSLCLFQIWVNKLSRAHLSWLSRCLKTRMAQPSPMASFNGPELD